MQSGIKDTSVPFGNTIFDIVGCNLGMSEVGQVAGRRRGWLRHVFPFTSRRCFDALENCQCSAIGAAVAQAGFS